MTDRETYRPAFAPGKSPHPSPHISYGLPYPQACSEHLERTFKASRIYILASGTLSKNTDALDKLVSAISDDSQSQSVVGVTKGVKSHSYYSDILKIVKEAKETQADCLVTLGAGSLTDAAKVVSLALANNATTVDKLETLYAGSPTMRDPILPAKVPMIFIPTSLSAGEYTSNAGATNDETHHKHSFQHLSIGPRLIILDPELSRTTPQRIWLSTGIRAVDHCVEAICSLKPTPEGDETAERGLRKLLPGLLRTKASPDEVEPRLQCQLGAVDAIAAALLKVPMGGSHGIGHQLGPLGVGHGETSCILLPAVSKFNKRVNEKQQQKVLDILWSESSVKEVLEQTQLEKDKTDLGDALDAVLRALGMPRSLSEFGIGRDKLEALAEGSLSDRYCKTNPIPLEKKEQVREILEMVAK
ncbi:hypothetical protein P7C71_g3236, partial [Lecanoromycetidae sp. Uapishka_2]